PSSTFCSTVNHGNSANDWNTMATPLGGPWMVSPRHIASPEDGAIRPAMIRSSVDLPDPERPSSPTISPAWMVRSTFSSTVRASPLPFGNERHTLLMSIRLVLLGWSSMAVPSLSQTKTALAKRIERPPQQAVEQDHEN